jgi:hypothetical protein
MSVVYDVSLINRHARQRGVCGRWCSRPISTSWRRWSTTPPISATAIRCSRSNLPISVSPAGTRRRERRTKPGYRFPARPGGARREARRAVLEHDVEIFDRFARGAVSVAVRARLYFIRSARGAVLLHRKSRCRRDRRRDGNACEFRVGLVRAEFSGFSAGSPKWPHPGVLPRLLLAGRKLA